MNKEKPAIGILINALNLGGAEKQSLLQAKLMAEEFDVYYFVQRKKPRLKQHLEFIEKENINYIQLPGNLISRTFRLAKLIRKYRIRVVFAYLTLDNVLASLTSLFVDARFMGGIRNSQLPGVKFFFNWLCHRYFQDYTIFNNYSGRDLFIKKGFLPSKCIVIHNCIDNVRDEQSRTDGEAVSILSVGRFTYQKDYYTALKAISLLQDKCPQKKVMYTIVGDGELEDRIRKWIEMFHVNNVRIVKLPGDLGPYYAEADIYFLTSRFEGLPNTIMEAYNYSLPVVSTDVSDVKYLVRDGESGFLAPAGDYALLCEKLQVLVNDAGMRNRMALIGHRLLVQDFSELKYQQAFCGFTHNLLSE